MVPDPFRERIPRKISGGKFQNNLFLFAYTALKLVTVQEEECFHGGMANPFVPINERVVHDQRVAKGSSFGDEVRVNIQTAKGGVGLTDGGFKSTKVPDPRGTSGIGEQSLVQIKDLGD